MIGQQVSHFYIIRAIGAGGMGVVYEAQDTRLPRSVALKFLKPALCQDHDAVKRFKREARLASSLNHPNICTILDIDEGEEQSFIAMELLHGSSLKTRLAGGPLPLDEIVAIASQIADALTAAHEQRIIHRDITPGNVFVTVDGVVKLLDFGLAKNFPSLDEEEQTTDELTTTGAVVGTIHYMAPERFSDLATVDHRCDLFSFGVLLYQMATGSRPFERSSRNPLIQAIREQPHLPIRQLVPQHPVRLQRIIDTLLAKAPDERYQTARALRADLELLRQELVVQEHHEPESPRAAASVAVLPFEIIGVADDTLRQFRDGLAAGISSRLSAMRGLRVAPRTSTRAVAGRLVREIGRQLDVTLVLEGSVQHTPEGTRVIADLIDAEREQAIRPSLRVDRAAGELLVTQDSIARELCDGFAAALSPVISRRYTGDAEAYQAFKAGQDRWQHCFSGGWRAAIEHFERAVERDPDFALAHTALANAYNFLGFYSLMKPNLAFGVAASAAARALTIDPTLSAAYRELALARFGGDWDWDAAEQAFRRALTFDAADPLAHVYYSWLLILLGRHDAAYGEAQRGQAAAPRSRLVAASAAQTLYIGGRYDDAIAIVSECLTRDAGYAFAVHLRGLCNLALARRDEAVADLERAAVLTQRTPFHLGLLGRCYGQFGMRDEALQLVEELRRLGQDTYVPPQCYVFIYAGLGERQRALENQERAYQDGASPFNYLTPSIRDLYALDPYHKKRLEQMRLTV